ncbi:hypothetical protein [Austwickia chelonae]|uniref:hypothetical protein n=1 Tax=Austwickia chelonae TaxID=100225 RepID=UPI000E26F30A|nr:hypothetical protein [Austwickia chelonae]
MSRKDPAHFAKLIATGTAVLIGITACGSPQDTEPAAAPATASTTNSPAVYEVPAPTALTFSAALDANTAQINELSIFFPEGLDFTANPKFTKAQACEEPSGTLTTCPAKAAPQYAPARFVSKTVGNPAPTPTGSPPKATTSPSEQRPGRGGPTEPDKQPVPAELPSVVVKARDELGKFTLKRNLTGRQPGTIAASQVALSTQRVGQVLAPISGKFSFTSGRLIIRQRLTVVSASISPTQAMRFAHGTPTGKATFPSTLGSRTTDCLALVLTPPGAAASEPRAVCVLPEFAGTMPNLKATLRMTSESDQEQVAVPEIYLHTDRTGQNLVVTRLTAEGGREEVPVVVGAGDGVRRAVVSGLTPGNKLLRTP